MGICQKLCTETNAHCGFAGNIKSSEQLSCLIDEGIISFIKNAHRATAHNDAITAIWTGWDRARPGPNGAEGLTGEDGGGAGEGRGWGEAGTIGSAPTGVNAVIEALQSAGKNVDHIDMPVSPSRVWAAMQG